MAENEFICPICGEPTNKYYGNYRKDKLCYKHGIMANAGAIVQCEECGKWHNADEECDCAKDEKHTVSSTSGFDKCIICGDTTENGWKYLCPHCYMECLDITRDLKLSDEKQYDLIYKNTYEQAKNSNSTNQKDLCIKLVAIAKAKNRFFSKNQLLNTVEDDIKNILTTIEQAPKKKCLLCNNDSGEYLFCKSCFNKYRNKTLLLKITVTKDQQLELLDESYEGLYVCKDGHVVKSKSERDIDNYFFEHKIAHAYEKALTIKGEIFHPDFYLPELDLYLEHWGYDESNVEYTKRKEYKIPKYKEKGITLICTYEKDMKDVETSLDIKLDTYKKGEINE